MNQNFTFFFSFKNLSISKSYLLMFGCVCGIEMMGAIAFAWNVVREGEHVDGVRVRVRTDKQLFMVQL